MMEVYRSLIFRELKILHRSLVWKSVLVLFFALFMLIPFVVAVYSEQADGDIIYMLVMVCGSVPFLTAALAGSGENVYKSDVNSGWKTFCFTLPVTSVDRTFAAFAVRIAMILSGAVLTFVYAFAGNMIAGDLVRNIPVVRFMIMSYMFSLFLITAYTTVEQAVIMRANDEKSVKRYSVIAGVLGLVAYLLAPGILDKCLTAGRQMDLSEDDCITAADMLDPLFSLCSTRNIVACVIAVLLMLAVGFSVTVLSYERREP